MTIDVILADGDLITIIHATKQGGETITCTRAEAGDLIDKLIVLLARTALKG